MKTRKNQAGGLFGIFNSKEKQLRDALLKSQQPDFIKAATIVNNGAKVNAVLYENVTPLYYALDNGILSYEKTERKGAFEFIKLLLEKGADVNFKSFDKTPIIMLLESYSKNPDFYYRILQLICSKNPDKTGAIDLALKLQLEVKVEQLLRGSCGASDAKYPPLTSENVARKTKEQEAMKVQMNANSAARMKEYNISQQAAREKLQANAARNNALKLMGQGAPPMGGSRRKLKKHRISRNKTYSKKRVV